MSAPAKRRQALFWRILTFAAVAALLGGCVTTGEGSVTGGECKVFTSPKYAVRGATQYDQDWADSTIEGGVGACKWIRPAPRPPEMDTPRAPRAAKPAKKRTLAARIKAKIWPVEKVAPVVDVPTPATAPAPPSAPRSAVDELLQPSDWSK